MRGICRDCQCYCIHCQICHTDKEIHKMNDSCSYFTPYPSDEENKEESEDGE